jgi:hypothetical protein
VIVASISELRSSIEDRLEPRDTIERCLNCHENLAWENRKIDIEAAIDGQVEFMKNMKELFKDATAEGE